MLIVYRTVRSLCGGCIYSRVDIMAVLAFIHLSNIFFFVFKGI